MFGDLKDLFFFLKGIKRRRGRGEEPGQMGRPLAPGSGEAGWRVKTSESVFWFRLFLAV